MGTPVMARFYGKVGFRVRVGVRDRDGDREGIGLGLAVAVSLNCVDTKTSRT